MIGMNKVNESRGKRVIIIEDEILSQAKLEAMLKKIDPSVEVIARLASVKDAVQYLSESPVADVAFVDIQLSDDHSFEIFKNVSVQFPLIFTTAYDQYLLQSFEYNSIDYLLKPLTEEKLRRSLDKLKSLESHFMQGRLEKLLQDGRRVPGRLVARKGTEFVSMPFSEIAYFYTEHKIVFLKDNHGRQFIMDKTLSELEQELDAMVFFRLNRKFLANVGAIEKFKPENGKIRIHLRPDLTQDVYVSKETAPDFRRWIGR